MTVDEGVKLLTWLGQNQPDILYKHSEDDDLGEVAYRQTIEEFLTPPVPAICTPMANKPLGEFDPAKITAKEVITELRDAWKEFGKHNYFDKGADEVINVERLAQRIRIDHDATGIINLLKEVAKVKDSEALISSILQSYDDDEDLFEQLEMVDADFIGDHY